VCFAALLGILTSRVFNHALGVSSFVNESVGDWVSWGAKSTLLPILIISVVLVVASHLAMVLRLLTHRSRPIGLVDAARRRIDNFLQRFRLNDAANAASVILVVTTASLTTAFWHFYPLVLASVGTIADASPADLALLSPANHLQHTHFRETFTLLALFSVTAWWTVLKFASRHGQKVSRSMVAGGAAVTILSVVLLSLPYRILRHNKFERATWSGYRCYVIGEGAADLLVFCPQAPVPRSYTVPRNDGALKRFAKPENIFTLLSPANSRAQGEKP
jgi:hypothetical protein